MPYVTTLARTGRHLFETTGLGNGLLCKIRPDAAGCTPPPPTAQTLADIRRQQELVRQRLATARGDRPTLPPPPPSRDNLVLDRPTLPPPPPQRETVLATRRAKPAIFKPPPPPTYYPQEPTVPPPQTRVMPDVITTAVTAAVPDFVTPPFVPTGSHDTPTESAAIGAGLPKWVLYAGAAAAVVFLFSRKGRR